MNVVVTPIQPSRLDSFLIHNAMRAPGRGMLDPITVILQDMDGRGRIIVECYGSAWSAYFGSIGRETLREFIATSDKYYLATKLQISGRHMTRKGDRLEQAYLQDIASAIIDSLKGAK